MICTLHKRVALNVRGLNSYSMIVELKTICLRWTNVPSLERPHWAKSQEHSSEQSSPNAQARSEQAVELRRRNKRAVRALDRKLITARPRTQQTNAGVGGFLSAQTNFLPGKQEVAGLFHRFTLRNYDSKTARLCKLLTCFGFESVKSA